MMVRMSERDAWGVLELPPGRYSAEEIHQAYLRRAAVVHPDRGGTREQWDELVAAYALLAAGGEYWPEDRPEPDSITAGLWWTWRTLRRSSRVALVSLTGSIVIGGGVVPLWIAATEQGIPWQFPAVVGGYVTSWWLWWLGQEVQRPPVWKIKQYLLHLPDERTGIDG